MQTLDQQTAIEKAIAVLDEANPQQTLGKWLENLTVDVGPFIRDWNLAQCWHWTEWPEREQELPDSTGADTGIDVVAVNRDGEYVAIQCKARQLDEHGRGDSINKPEIDSFASISSAPLWSERWIVTNGDNPLGPNAMSSVPRSNPIKVINIANDLVQQQGAFTDEHCPHCEPNSDGEERRQSKSCMQAEAIDKSVRTLRQHEQSDSGGLPLGQARGKIILPCGTGKTRISLRIVEELTPPGELSIVLCPSIALVAQIRREYLQHANTDIRALAVCSDETAGYDPKKESTRNTAADPTLDNSNVSANEVKGKVTTDPAQIAHWIRDGQATGQLNVIFGTYQSGSRIAEALQETGVTAKVLVCDEAHRTAGLRRKGKAKSAQMSEQEQRIRDFTLCHNNDAFPATYRVYQTATPRIYDTTRVNQDQASDWIVRSMDHEATFGVELYRKSYTEAVNNRWLADYRIIAVGVNGPDEFRIANTLAGQTQSKGRNPLTSAHFLRGLAFSLAMGGATQQRGEGTVPIKSCIAFMNTVDKSSNMVEALETPAVRDWLQGWLDEHQEGQTAASYTLEHLDANSNVTARDNAKRRLAESTEENPHGIINVGIFGEGTDSPTLNAVAFLEARRSPIDVIQAVGRAMRVADGKDMGYIICPILIPPNADPESWLSSSNMEEGWQELGQILLALRAHDQRIEDNLSDLLHLYIPKAPESLRTIVAVATGGEEKRIHYREHEGAPGEAQVAVERVLDGKSTLSQEFSHITETTAAQPEPTPNVSALALTTDGEYAGDNHRNIADEQAAPHTTLLEPTQIIAGKKNEDGSKELRVDTVVRAKPAANEIRGKVDIRKSKDKARNMINKGEGQRIPTTEEKAKRPTRAERTNTAVQLRLSELEDEGNAIKMNLLGKSGLVSNRVVRDLNILESSISQAADDLRNDELQPALDHHFGLDNLKDDKRKSQADGCTIAALLMMNAAMLHQRIANGHWLTGVSDLDTVKNDVNVVHRLRREWERIMRHDFHPVLEPAVGVIYAVEDTGKLAGLQRALHIIAAEAERIADTYADMGADHAGPLFNRVMGNQASDGAFFTRPVAASIAARLTLDTCGEQDWTNPEVWKEHKTVDLACGSGTLLAAMLTDMKRRAQEQGANETQIAELQKLAVEDTIKGLDINPVSLQLAASQLTAGNHDIRYRRMGLHQMPYGPNPNDPLRVSVGTLELLGQRAIVARDGELNIPDNQINSQIVWSQPDDAELEDAVDAVKNARIVTMNPPFSNRSRMGEKFPTAVQQALRSRVDHMERVFVHNDKSLEDFVDKNALEPLFTALADRCVQAEHGVLTMINPTAALCASSALEKRRVMAKRYHIHTVLTGRWPREFTLSQNVEIDECIVIAVRHDGVHPPTRFVHLDRMPHDEDEVAELHQALRDAPLGLLADGWGEVSEWPTEHIAEGDWTPAIWRSRDLAEAARQFAENTAMRSIGEHGYNCWKTSAFGKDQFIPALPEQPGSFPMISSKGADGQITIRSTPDSQWQPTNADEERRIANGGTYPEVDKIIAKAGNLLVTSGQAPSTARVTAIANDEKYVGRGFLPITGPTVEEAKAVAVFINSTAGRLQLLRNAGRKLAFPIYNPKPIENIRIPDVKDVHIRETLAGCWEQTKDIVVPQFSEGECEVRRLWDEAVAKVMEWDASELARLRHLLHQEPHVRGLGYGQYADAPDIELADRERFVNLADQWEHETVLLSSTDQVTEHPAHQEIISMGEPVLPLILERMKSHGGHWFHALHQITGTDPVSPDDRGNVPAMQESWLHWGEHNGLV